jgi:hypothetical protein
MIRDEIVLKKDAILEGQIEENSCSDNASDKIMPLFHILINIIVNF